MFFKEQKAYSHVVFVLVLVIILLLGVRTWVPAQQVRLFLLLLLIMSHVFSFEMSGNLTFKLSSCGTALLFCSTEMIGISAFGRVYSS